MSVAEHWRDATQPEPWSPWLPAPPAQLEFALDHIRFGWVQWSFRIDGERHIFWFDDLEDDLGEFADWVLALTRGGFPRGRIADALHMAACDSPLPEAIQLCLTDPQQVRRLSLPREEAARAMRDFCRMLADDPALGPMFLNHVCHNAAEYDREMNAAETLWIGAHGKPASNDEFDMMDDAVAAHLTATLTVSPDEQAFVEHVRAKLHAAAGA